MFPITNLKMGKWHFLSKVPFKVNVLILLILSCIGLTYYCHFILGIDVVFTHFFYLPIIWAGFWWGRRVLRVAVLLGGWLMVSHLLSGLDIPFTTDLLRFGMFVVVGLVVGTLREQTLKAEEASKLAYTELEAAKSYAENIISNFLDTLIVTNPDGTIRTINQATLDLLEYKEEELIGKLVGTIFAEEEEEEEEEVVKPFFTGTLQDLLQRGVMRNYELTYVTKSGQRIPMSFNASVMRNEKGEIVGLVAGAKDISKLKQEITERRQAEEALLKSEERYKKLVASVTDYIYTVKVENGHPVKTTHGPGCVNVTGYTADEYEADPNLWYEMIYEEDRKAVLKQAEKVLLGERLPPLEHRIIHKNGSIRWIMNTPVARYSEKGQLIAYDGLIADVTESKRLEGQLLQSQKMEAVGQLAGGIAHDFNNLLTAITGYSDLLLIDLSPDDPRRSDVEEIKKAARQAGLLTHQLLAFSRKQMLQPEVLNINAVVSEMKKMLRRLIGEDIHLGTVLEPILERVKADPGQIEQVIMNLVVNARDAMPEGGKLTIKTENVTIDEEQCKVIPEAHPGKFVCLSVADTGVGIDKETINQIFEPFFTTKALGEGSGLGLSVVYGIVKQHEGWINVYTEPGQGSIFKVYLPVFSVKMEEETKETISLEEPQGKGERILLVEDEEGVRKFIARVLDKNGYLVFESTNAKEALDTFEKEKGNFHLVFSDIVLPDKSGLQLVDQLLSHKPELRILLSSGYTEQKSQLLATSERGLRFIQKPYSLADLLRVVREAMEPTK